MMYNMLLNGHTICPETWGMKDASEVFHRIYYVYGGEAYYTFDNRTVQLQRGRLYVFPVMQPYTMWQNPHDPLDVLWFHIETDKQLCTTVTEISVNDNSVDKHLLEVLRLLVEETENFKKISKIFDVLLMQIMECVQLSPMLSGRMDVVLAYVEKHIGEQLTVQGLADLIDMDRACFSRKFKSVFNMTPQKYITAKKMRAASDKLVRGASIYEAATAAGYTDEKAFSRAFKRYIEISPGEYRKARWVQP